MAYNKDTDYQALINDAVSKGDYGAAARYEQARNEKITGEGLGYATTNKYSSYLMPAGYNGSSNNVYTFNDDQNRIRQQMNQNSMDWWNADATGKTVLENANKQLAANLGSGVGFNSQTGTWSGVADQPISMKTGVDMAMPTFDYNEYLSSNPKPTYDSPYLDSINTLLDQILNREKFSYDVETDPLYQQYKKQYIREGNRAMNDTLASMASGAGGMNTWAATAAQQANDYHMAQLGDRIPELYQLAYSMYMDDIAGQRADLSMLQGMDNTMYGRYRDDVSDWYSDYDNTYNDYRYKMGDYQWGTEFNYNAEQDAIDRDWQQKEWDYGIERDAVSDARNDRAEARELAIAILESGRMPSADLLAQAGISSSDAKLLMADLEPVDLRGTPDAGIDDPKPKYETDDTPAKKASDGVKLTDAQIKELQRYYGVTADGKWGPASSKAAGGRSAEEAWLEYQKAKKGDYTDPKLDAKKPAIGETESRKFWNSMTNLGISPVTAELVSEIAAYGGVSKNSDGTVSWANGWNKENYQWKLDNARKAAPFMGVPH